MGIPHIILLSIQSGEIKQYMTFMFSASVCLQTNQNQLPVTHTRDRIMSGMWIPLEEKHSLNNVKCADFETPSDDTSQGQEDSYQL